MSRNWCGTPTTQHQHNDTIDTTRTTRLTNDTNRRHIYTNETTTRKYEQQADANKNHSNQTPREQQMAPRLSIPHASDRNANRHVITWGGFLTLSQNGNDAAKQHCESKINKNIQISESGYFRRLALANSLTLALGFAQFPHSPRPLSCLRPRNPMTPRRAPPLRSASLPRPGGRAPSIR